MRWFTTTSAATFAKGSLVNLGTTHLLEEYASTDSQYLGIAMSHSTASTPVVGGTASILVAIPAPNCTAYSDLTTGVTASALSVGKSSLIYKQGNHMSYASTVMGEASRFSALCVIVGPVQADTSQVEIAFTALTGVIYSSSSATFAT
jgi:hypothetical protein